MKKVITTVLSAALIAATLVSGAIAAPFTGAAELSKAQSTDIVQVRNRGGAVAAGVVGGLAVGALIGSQVNRGGYYNGCNPRYEYCGQPVYARPAYRGRGLVWNDDRGCYVSRRDYWGPCY
ncbi:MAG: hypothetical protein V4691_06105 [Pseudomonadota bacterium]